MVHLTVLLEEVLRLSIQSTIHVQDGLEGLIDAGVLLVGLEHAGQERLALLPSYPLLVGQQLLLQLHCDVLVFGQFQSALLFLLVSLFAQLADGRFQGTLLQLLLFLLASLDSDLLGLLGDFVFQGNQLFYLSFQSLYLDTRLS